MISGRCNVIKKLKRLALPIIITLSVVITVCVIAIKRKTVTIVINGQSKKVVTYKNKVSDVLKSKSIQIGSKDKIVPSLASKVTEGETILIKRAVSISINVDGKELKIKSSENNVHDMLKAENITVNPQDKVQPKLETVLSEGIKIDIIRVETKTVENVVPIDFKTVVKYNSSLANTQKRTISEGKKGEKRVSYSIVYENGKEVSRKITKETILEKPQDKVVALGTYPLMPVSRGGDMIAYSSVIKVRATAYSAIHGIGTTYTASGRTAVRDPDGYSTIAVDPRVIPLGTRVFIEGYGFAIAADTGVGVKGNKVDVFFNTNSEAISWSVKYVNLYILK